MKEDSPYEEKYSRKEYYWGKESSGMCDRIIDLFQMEDEASLKLLDIGCGEGRNTVYFAKNKFDVIGLDISKAGLEKTRRYANDVGVHVKTIHADILTYELRDTYDVIFSTGTLHYLPPQWRKKRFQNYKECTAPRGINAFSVFVDKPFLSKAPDAEDTAYSYKSGELMSYYWDWEILYCTEEIFDCMSSGIPHKHAVNRVIARRWKESPPTRV
ncbi:MAG: class I SAM-dependent methyltransferase [Candidatus Korarchaeota archaeon]|nr:class I SAM-dependent methyltransferase [Candidatus Korarchaeota archaeon]NIU84916.1 methyltransferase domain-containing protein [Candidatus Thorarchaeota archaeon]NIW15729.1 methyltransferase domain-containing protein [Candidatus Thorarchaeota archaeon]NIW53654.1 methyltransferase domain-containing protein [Candidatus Korarchaeota archaeon]